MSLPPAAIRAALPVAVEDCIETHISWVLLAGEFAYKIKKPVTLPFLDYGSVDKRRACCAAELRLNRRFAPGLYLEVVDLAGEPAVKMRRFDEQLRLDHVCRRGALTTEQLTGLACRLAAFQAQAAVASADTPFGTPATVLADALENFEELERLLPEAGAQLARLKDWSRDEFTRHAETFARRKAGGYIREGHGDLHLGNLVLLDGQVTPFDGIEFSEDFRWIDVASEIAFTLLDLLDHDQPGLATWLLNEWLTQSGDYDALSVLRFYLVYRAMVRAKVAAIRHDAGESLEYLHMAERLATSSTPALTITCGLSGSGKTWASGRRLAGADFLRTVRIRSDVERKRLFGLAPHDSSAASDSLIYTAEATRRTYDRMAELAEAALGAGWSVIVDAAFLKRAERDAFRALAKQLGVPFAILATVAFPDELAQRITARQNDASEATVAVLEQQLQWFEPPGADEPALNL